MSSFPLFFCRMNRINLLNLIIIPVILFFLVCANDAAKSSEMLDLEKEGQVFGFLKLSDMAPLAIGYEKGQLGNKDIFVKLEPQSNWQIHMCPANDNDQAPTVILVKRKFEQSDVDAQNAVMSAYKEAC